jgi:hypothetical protein
VIVCQEADELVIVRQADHSMLSGWLAALWGGGPWERPEPYVSCVVGARMHDVIWVPWDEALPRREDGIPYNFNEVARPDILPYQKRGIDSVVALDPYGGLLVSLHFSGFYHSHWGWESGRVEPADKEAVDRHVEAELERQRGLRRQLRFGEADERRLECNYKWLQMWDRISRDLCLYGFDAGYEIEEPPVPAGAFTAGDLRLRIKLEPGGVCRLDPYPLTIEPYSARIPCVRVPRSRLEELPVRWREGGHDSVDVTFMPF